MTMRTVEEKLQAAGAVSRRTTQGPSFNCTLLVALARRHGTGIYVAAQAPGHLTWPPAGVHGHGYDPVFVPEGEEHSFRRRRAKAREKQISHRRGRQESWSMTSF